MCEGEEAVDWLFIQVLVFVEQVEDEVRGQVEIGNVLEPGRTVVEPRGDGWTL